MKDTLTKALSVLGVLAITLTMWVAAATATPDPDRPPVPCPPLITCPTEDQ